MARADTLVDATVILDILTADTDWAAWSKLRIADAVDAGAVAINPVIYAEVSVYFESREDLEDAIPAEEHLREQIPWAAAFLAGKCFLEYRRRGGTRRLPLSDFFIGAHAAVAGMRLLTRDPARYRTYFPRLELIAPA